MQVDASGGALVLRGEVGVPARRGLSNMLFGGRQNLRCKRVESRLSALQTYVVWAEQLRWEIAKA